MKFQDIESGREKELHIVKGSSYWSDSAGELYTVDIYKGTHHWIRPVDALAAVLGRKEMKNGPGQAKAENRALNQAVGGFDDRV